MQTITRAEMVEILITAADKADAARALAGTSSLPGTGGRWASRYIAVARSLG